MDTPQEEALFGRWLRRRRRVLDLTQKALARRAGCSAATIRKLEADERHPSEAVALALASALGVPDAERAAFVRFARGGWANRSPEVAPGADRDRPWAYSMRTAPAPVGRAHALRPAPEEARSGATSPEALGTAVVAREPELRWLHGALEEASSGRGRVALVAGEAGQGKTTLLRAFAEDAQAKHGELLVVTGTCNAYTGSGDPFLPFRQVLQQLTGDVPTGPELEPLEAVRAERLAQYTPRACQTLLEHGQQLVGTLLPAEPFLKRAAQAGVAVPEGRTWGRGAEVMALQGPLASVSHAALSAVTTRLLTTVADDRPLLLLLDDLQWLDQSSADLLLHLGRDATGHRVLVVGAYRAADVVVERDGGRHVMKGVVHEMERTYGDAVLDLDHADGRAFLEAWLDSEPNTLDAAFREALWRQTGGQPLFTIELLRAMQERGDLVRNEEGRWGAADTVQWDALPQRVAGALAERVDRLSRLASGVLKVASVEGELFTAEAVARVLGEEAREVTAVLGGELERKHRLVAGVDVRRFATGLVARYRFRHNLIQRFVYEGIDGGERSYLHEAVAVALAAVLGDEADPVALAHHYTLARAPERAAVHHRRAGDRARKAGALDRAIEHYQAALASWNGADPVGRATLLRELGESQWISGHLDDARLSLGEALTGFRALDDVRAAGTVQLVIARTHWEDGDWHRSFDTCREALAMLEEGPETPELAFAQSSLAQLYMVADESAEGLTWGWRALETAERLGAEYVRAHALTTMGSLLVNFGANRSDEGLGMFSDSYELADRLELPYEACRAGYNHGEALRKLGRFDEAKARWEALLDYARDHQVALFEGMALHPLWQLAWKQGRWTSCIAERPHMQQLADGAGVFDTPMHPVVVLLASADVDVGHIDRARNALQRSEPVLSRLVDPQWRGPHLRELLRIAVLSGRPEDADALALEIAETARGKRYGDSVVPPVLSALQWMVSRSSRTLRAAAQECLEGLEGAESRYRASEARAAAAEARGTFAAAGADPEAAATQLLDAAEHWRACGFPLDEARTRGAAARELKRSEKDSEAAAELQRLHVLLDDLAAQLPTEELQESFASVRRRLLFASATGRG